MTLVERDAALAALRGWNADVQAGHGRLVLVNGEAGVGKTSLLQAFVASHPEGARGVRPRLLWSACDTLATPRPLGPLADLASAFGGKVEALLRPGAAGDQAGGGSDQPGVPREELFGSLLTRLSDESRSWIIIVEDLHWADDATLDLIRFLARRIADVRVLIVAATATRSALRIRCGCCSVTSPACRASGACRSRRCQQGASPISPTAAGSIPATSTPSPEATRSS